MSLTGKLLVFALPPMTLSRIRLNIFGYRINDSFENTIIFVSHLLWRSYFLSWSLIDKFSTFQSFLPIALSYKSSEIAILHQALDCKTPHFVYQQNLGTLPIM